jgi:CHASE2 domain-containing sensor protein
VKNKKKILFGMVASVAIIVAAFGLREAGLLSNLGQNLSTRLYHERELSKDIVIVAIDEYSLSAPEQGGLDGLQSWTREIYADTLNEIEAGSPSLVFFDVLFFLTFQRN